MKTSPRNAAASHYSPSQVRDARAFLGWLGNAPRRDRKAASAFFSGSRRNMTRGQLALAAAAVPAIA